MQLVALLAHAFTPTVQRHGRSYYHGRRVHIREGTPSAVEALVQDTGRYQVTLERTGSVVSGACTCPVVLAREEPCKHLWATVLAADAYGYLLGDGPARRLTFTLHAPDALPRGTSTAPWKHVLEAINRTESQD